MRKWMGRIFWFYMGFVQALSIGYVLGLKQQVIELEAELIHKDLQGLDKSTTSGGQTPP